MNTNFWPLSVSQAHKGKVPGTSNWVAEILYDCNEEVLKDVNQIYNQFSDDVNDIDQYMRNALNVKDVDNFIDSFQDIDNNVYGPSGSNRASRISSVKASPVFRAHTHGSSVGRSPAGRSPAGRSPLSRPMGSKSTKSSPLKNTMNSVSPKKQLSAYTERKSQQDQIIIPSTSPKTSRISQHNPLSSAQSIPQPSVLSGLQPVPQSSTQHVAIPQPKSTQSTHPTDPNPPVETSGNHEHTTQSPDNPDDSFHKIQMSIRRQTEAMTVDRKEQQPSKSSSVNNSLNFPTKTPKRSPTFVSLPPKEPLTIKSSASHISRRSLAHNKERKDSTSIKLHQLDNDNDYNNSPIRRNRFPSSINEMPNVTTENEQQQQQQQQQKKEHHHHYNRHVSNGFKAAGNSGIIPDRKSLLDSIKSNSTKKPNLSDTSTTKAPSKDLKIANDEPEFKIEHHSPSLSSTTKFSTTPSTSSKEPTISRPRNLFYNVMTPTAVHKAYSSSRISPARRILSRTSKTPSKSANPISRSSISSLDTTKPGSKSPTRYTERQLKKSSIASKDDDNDSYLLQKSSVPQKRPASPIPIENRTTKTPKHNDGDGTNVTKNKFLTTSLNPNNGPTRLPSKLLQSPVKMRLKPQGSQVPPGHLVHDDNNNIKSNDKNLVSSLDTTTIPPLRKKSLMNSKNEIPAKPKQKIVLSMNHSKKSSANLGTPSTSASNTPKLNSLGASKHKLELPRNTEGPKKRPLGGNAVALPEAARPQHLTRVKEVGKNNQLALPKPDLRPQVKTPKGKSDFQLFKNVEDLDHEPELPDIDTDDEDNASKRLLKSWAATPELRRLILKNNQVDPKSIFGEVPKLRIEDIFKSEASRIRGNAPSPIRYSKSRDDNKPGVNG